MPDWRKLGPSVFYETEQPEESAYKGNNALVLFLLILRGKKDLYVTTAQFILI